MTASDFRAAFPEFTSTVSFPDTAVNYWLGIAPLLINSDRWGQLKDHGTALFVAHNLVLEALALQTVLVGGLPGLNKGAISSEGTGGTSLSYDTGGASELDAGHWNNTVYGTRYIRLARLAGAGPLQVGTCGSTGISAWAGPPSGFIPGL